MKRTAIKEVIRVDIKKSFLLTFLKLYYNFVEFANDEVIDLKKLLFIILMFLLLILVAGCKKVVNTRHKNVEVIIKDSYYKGEYITLIWTGKNHVPITHPARYGITVEYNACEYIIKDKKTYEKYKDKIEKSATGVLEFRTYDDGTAEYSIVKLLESG